MDDRAPAEASGGLDRSLGAWPATAIVVGTMIGTGIFLKPSEIAQQAGGMGWALADALRCRHEAEDRGATEMKTRPDDGGP